MKTEAETNLLREERVRDCPMGTGAILEAKKDGGEFARQEGERRVGRRRSVSSRGNCSCSRAQR